ncbi:Fe(2+) transporter permease subunit FeoB [Alginatibacterium sediminis]|uniref:Ferrous iron transport protein B n=1 Tax=Alginatibacterium sediminis TaxID=2164068 RepID=A0A420EGP4_9ALTE|nr:Fe(2+) transporter permease subunit FeoB [Alginatibacterium sediminis]RKF19834.1 Fe(2+) transporter permease subunit FeoB [Alginatibacterium sediminis]
MMRIVTVGNPNSGKTTLFNALSGSRQRVGNFSGVTVDKKSATINVNHTQCELVDLPGIYNLHPQEQEGSVDEQVAADYLRQGNIDLVINVVDAATIERSLYLTLQLRELGLPVLLVLNKMDSAKVSLLDIKLKQLGVPLGVEVAAISATDPLQVADFKHGLVDHVSRANIECLHIDYSADVEAFIQQWSTIAQVQDIRARCLALIDGESTALADLSPQQRQQLQTSLSPQKQDQFDLEIADCRYSFIYTITQACVRKKGQLAHDLSERLDTIFLNKWLGIPLFFAMMYAMFMFAINGGAIFIDFFDIAAGTIFVDGVRELGDSIGLPQWTQVVLSDGFGSGIQTVATFIPVILFLYLYLALMESSGYLARAAFVVDRLMQKLGLPGKAFVPMLMGFGCTVPAIMATRVLDKQRERKLTSAMSPFMSCGARLPVYALFAAAFFPQSGQNLVFILYVVGILAAVFTGMVLKHTLLPGKTQDSILELPDWQIPRLKNVMILTYQKVKGFIFGAGKTIVVVVAILSILNNISFQSEGLKSDNSNSILSQASQLVTPLFSPMGIENDNWQATVGIVTGIFAKEAVVGTLNSLYSPSVDEHEEWTYLGRSQEAIESIVENTFDMDFSDPLGIAVDVADTSSEAATINEVEESTLTRLQSSFTQASAFSYLLFILMYLPCAAAMGALVKEHGRPWASFIALWSTGLAYASAVLFYQLSQINTQPLQASLISAVVIGMTLSVIIALKIYSRRSYDLASA